MPKITLAAIKKAINDQSDRVVDYEEIFALLKATHPEIKINKKTEKYWWCTISQKVAEEIRNAIADKPDVDFNKHIYLRFGKPGDYCVPVIISKPQKDYFYANANHNGGCDLGIYIKRFEQPIEDYRDFCIQTWGAKVIDRKQYMRELQLPPNSHKYQTYPGLKSAPMPGFVPREIEKSFDKRGATEFQSLRSLRDRQQIK